MKFKQIINSILGKAGYQICKLSPEPDISRGFTLYTYLRKDGTFDYEKYRQIQIEGNKLKIDTVWAREENIDFLSRYILEHIGTPKFGICHGTRRGLEQMWFGERLNCKVIGTEISDTAEQFPNTIQWDFHEIKAEWLGAVDFIYSNSFDHSYDPEKCLNAWMTCIRPGGFCIIEHASAYGASPASPLDPLDADIVQMPYLITIWGKGAYYVREILSSPIKSEELKSWSFIVISKS
jgi:hypothetical protein